MQLKVHHKIKQKHKTNTDNKISHNINNNEY